MTESVLITAAIDEEEGCYVAVIDIFGAFLYADRDDVVVIVLCGKIAKLIAAVAPEIQKVHYLWKGWEGYSVCHAPKGLIWNS